MPPEKSSCSCCIDQSSWGHMEHFILERNLRCKHHATFISCWRQKGLISGSRGPCCFFTLCLKSSPFSDGHRQEQSLHRTVKECCKPGSPGKSWLSKRRERLPRPRPGHLERISCLNWIQRMDSFLPLFSLQIYFKFILVVGCCFEWTFHRELTQAVKSIRVGVTWHLLKGIRESNMKQWPNVLCKMSHCQYEAFDTIFIKANSLYIYTDLYTKGISYQWLHPKLFILVITSRK